MKLNRQFIQPLDYRYLRCGYYTQLCPLEGLMPPIGHQAKYVMLYIHLPILLDFK